MKPLSITVCPTCGSPRIRRVKRSIESRRGGQVYTAKGIVIEECPDCGERLFSPQALQQIAAQKPDSVKRPQKKTA